MIQAIITSGFIAGSSSVSVTADVADGTDILIYDDETKVLLGADEITDGTTVVSVSPVLYSGQRIIAYVASFGSDTFGAVIVVDSDTEFTGWKEPVTVDGDPYAEYLADSGEALPDIYDPASVRNISRDKDAIDQVINLPITFLLRLTESLAGSVQASIENVQNAIGGFIVKFDADAEGSTATKNYTVNGSYQAKVWGANQTIADAILVTYNVVVPVATVEFGTNLIDLSVQIDWGYTASPGFKVIKLLAHTTVAAEFQIDGLFTWESGTWESSLSMRSSLKFIPAGTYTIRARRASNPAETISREIKLTGF